MQEATRHTWVLVASCLAGAVAAGVVYIVTTDVVWTLVPLLLTVALVRRQLARKGPGPRGGSERPVRGNNSL
jgi:hypothetical protein